MAFVQLSWSFTIIVFIYFLINISKVSSNSYFEIKINSFTNNAKVDINGDCCTGGFSNNICNSSVCRTFFQICLTNFQMEIPTSPECTFGRQVTPVIGHNTFSDSFQNGFENPIRIPMEFEWPGDFTLVIEAMHDVTDMHVEEGSQRNLLSRLVMTDAVDAATTWTNSTHTTDQYHHTLEISYRVLCMENRYGPRCEKECVPRDNYFAHYTCDSEGNKVCLDGWTGLNCVTPVCEGCEHGNCNAPNFCECQSGWTGEKCDECKLHPSCGNGYCQAAFQCICEPGWRGIFCKIDATFCSENNPCRNGGMCESTDTGSGYVCNCPSGFTGSHCEITEEQDHACGCQNGGTCRFVDDGVQACVCPSGFIGNRCELEATCPCLNGGSCHVVSNAYSCVCPTGYTGSTCENYNDCLSVETPCQNGGTCVDGTNSYSCACAPGFVGDTCETNICSDNPCLNGGTCNGLADGMQCICSNGYSGNRCQNIDNMCLSQPCANGGICFNLDNDYRCNCPDGFEGKDCSVNINECTNNPCKNGATCLDLVNNFSCICAPGYKGNTCTETSTIISTILKSDQQPTQQSIHVSIKKDSSNSPKNDQQTHNQSSTETDLKQILIYCFCGLLIVLIIILLCIIVYRKNHVQVDTEKGNSDIEPNNKVYTDNFSKEKKVLPLSSISNKVCNEESESYSKGTSKQFSNLEDYQKDIYTQKVLHESTDSLSEKISTRQAYQKKIPERRKDIDVCHPKLESYTSVLIINEEKQTGSKQININNSSSVTKEQSVKGDYLATQV